MSEEKRITLANLEQHLAALQDIENEIAPEQELEFQVALQEALMKVAEKRDRVAFVIEDLMRQAAIARAVIDAYTPIIERLEAREDRFTNRARKIKNNVICVMRTLPKPAKGPRRLEGLTSTLKANGVAPSVEVLNESQVPLVYKRVTVKMTALQWKVLQGELLLAGAKLTYEVDRTALLEALKKPCSPCNGTGERFCGQMEGRVESCEACNGTGKQLVAGARLETEKLRLVIE